MLWEIEMKGLTISYGMLCLLNEKKCIQERFKPLKVKHWKKQSLPQICNVNVYPLKEITKKRVKTMLYAIIWHDR